MHYRCASDPVLSGILFSRGEKVSKDYCPSGLLQRVGRSMTLKGNIQTRIPTQGKEDHKGKRITNCSE